MFRIVGNQFFFVPIFQIDIELGNTYRLKLTQFIYMLLNGTENRKTFDHVRCNKVEIRIITLSMLRVIIASSILYVSA